MGVGSVRSVRVGCPLMCLNHPLAPLGQHLVPLILAAWALCIRVMGALGRGGDSHTPVLLWIHTAGCDRTHVSFLRRCM